MLSHGVRKRLEYVDFDPFRPVDSMTAFEREVQQIQKEVQRIHRDPLTRTFSGDGHPILFCGFLLPYFCESHLLRSATAVFIWIAPTDLLKVRRPIDAADRFNEIH
uniref:Uncharacterized protein n=1 Tax=Glossina austeni TaxID=7395 RepID=A0A1A9V7J2_GLOAU